VVPCRGGAPAHQASGNIDKSRWWKSAKQSADENFRFAGLPPINHPAIFACLGMVVGLYGILYLEVAPERGWLLAAVGLVGKILGPVGLAGLILSGAWPGSSVILCLTNDLVWWVPFSLYLYDSWPAFISDFRETPKEKPLRR
jgi:hypothetical protein